MIPNQIGCKSLTMSPFLNRFLFIHYLFMLLTHLHSIPLIPSLTCFRLSNHPRHLYYLRHLRRLHLRLHHPPSKSTITARKVILLYLCMDPRFPMQVLLLIKGIMFLLENLSLVLVLFQLITYILPINLFLRPFIHCLNHNHTKKPLLPQDGDLP